MQPTPISENPNLPQPPVFETVAEERLHRKQRLAAAFRLFARYGFDEGVAGHITARDPEFSDRFWVNPFGMYFGQIRVSDLLFVNDRGDILEGDRPVNAAAFAIHSQVHAARPDIVAAAHAHSLYGKTWSSLGRLLDPLTQDACAFYTTTPFLTTILESFSISAKENASAKPWAIAKPPFSAITAC